jgi:hypothetical protein
LKSIDRADALIVLDDSTKQYRLKNHAVLLDSLRGQMSVAHLSVRDCINAFTKYLPASALVWSKRTAQRDIAPIRNVSLILSRCFQTEHILLVDDDITEFDVATTRSWMRGLLEEYGSVVAGAHIGGVDETDIISRLEGGIRRACTCGKNNEKRISARESFTVSPVSAETVSRSEFVSGGYLSFKFASGEIEPFPPGYNEDWLWCLSLRSKAKASVFRIPQVVTHQPVKLRRPTENDIVFELRGDVAVQFEIASYRSYGPRLVRAGSDGNRHLQGDGDGPERWVEMLLAEAEQHKERCGASIADQFGPFGLEVVKRMHQDRRLGLDWEGEFDRWKEQSARNRDSFREAMGSEVTTELASALIEKGRT